MKLHNNWKVQGFEVGERRPLELAAADLDDRFWINTSVPADIHSIYIQRKLIPDPYFGHQDQASRFIERKEWWYRKSFQHDPVQSAQQSKTSTALKHELIFEGLDTFATIYFNGLEIGKAENMHRTYRFDVTRLLKNGKNVIAIRFDPLHLHYENKMLFDWSSYTKERPWIRKAAMNWGWDWGPRLVTVGIWKEVRLEQKHRITIEHLHVQTNQIQDQHAEIRVNVELTKARSYSQYQCRTMLYDAEGSIVAQHTVELEHSSSADAKRTVNVAHSMITQQTVNSNNSANNQHTASTNDTAVTQQTASVKGNVCTVQLTVAQPQLWWTHDLGKPYLYTLHVELIDSANDVCVAKKSQRVGIRTIKLQLENEQGQPHFQFVLNGVKLFAKGANWIPADHMIATISDQRYIEHIKLAVASNMNMLRVWAGGIYEKDIFYEQCDEQGLLVWQDFAFANTLFPDFNQPFEHNVKAEIIDNVKRLRSYTSLALWCGNNEIDWLYDMKSSEGSITSPFYGEAIYHEWIPELLEELDPDRPYWPSSPFGGNDANDPDVGDRHNWQVWHGSVYPRRSGDIPLLDYSVEGVSFKHYKQDFTLFSSEFGMHASANRFTLQSYIPEGEFYWNSDEMAYRNKDTNHLKGILLMEGYTGIPQSIEQYMNFSMLTQAEGLKYGIEHYRRHMHRTSGALIWQFNDSWPGTSWSLVDYLLLPKASYYYARRFFAPVLLTMEHEPHEPMKFYVVNDTLERYSGKVTVTLASFTGEQIASESYDVVVEPGCCTTIGMIEEALYLTTWKASDVVVVMSSNDLPVSNNYYYLRDHKELALPSAELEWSIDHEQQSVTVKANHALARMVKLEIMNQAVSFEDNYFDLLAGEQRVINVVKQDASIQWENLHITAINSYNT